MPTVPIFLGGLGGEGAHKVFLQADPQRLGNTDGDIDAARKVGIDLNRIQKDQRSRWR